MAAAAAAAAPCFRPPLLRARLSALLSGCALIPALPSPAPALLPCPPLTRPQLCAEDYLWWWRSYYRGGSISIYVLIYSIGFLVNTLHK